MAKKTNMQEKNEDISMNKKIDFIFLIILIFSILVIFFKCIFKGLFFIYGDIGSDTTIQYYPYFINEVLRIKQGIFSIWNFSYGLGTTVLNCNAWTFDPFGIALVIGGLILGASKVDYLMVFMQILKIIAIYFISKKYFKMLLKNQLSINLCSYLLSMNGYLFLWGQHYFLGTACFFTMLMLYSIERFIQNDYKKGAGLLSIATALLLTYSYYIGYMLLIICAIYFLYRLVSYKEINFKEFFISGLKTLYAIITGVLLSGIISIPSMYYVSTNSARLENSSDNIFSRLFDCFMESFNSNIIANRFSRLMSNNLLCINDSTGFETNYYELPQLFCTIFIFFFLIQFLILEYNKTLKNKKWIRFIVNNILLYFFVFSLTSGLVMNAFAYPAYRYTFAIIPFFVLAIGYVFDEIILEKKISIGGVIFSAFLSFIVLGNSYYRCTPNIRKYAIVVLGILILGYIIIGILLSKNKYYNKFMYAFCLIIVISTIGDNYITTNMRVLASNIQDKDEQQVYSDTKDAMEWIKEYDKSFYRVELTYPIHNCLSDSFLLLNSTNSCYNSSINKDVDKYYKNIYPNAFMEGNFAFRGFRLQSDYDLIATSITNSKYILSKCEFDFENLELINRVHDIYIYKNSYTDSVAKWYSKTISEENFEKLKEDEKAKKLINTVIIDKEKNFENSNAKVGEFILESDTYIKGNIENDGEGILMIAVPREEGWEVLVDGNKTDSFYADYGFVGINLLEGKHKIELKYNFPKYKIGIVCSGLGLLFFILELFLCKKKDK